MEFSSAASWGIITENQAPSPYSTLDKYPCMPTKLHQNFKSLLRPQPILRTLGFLPGLFSAGCMFKACLAGLFLFEHHHPRTPIPM